MLSEHKVTLERIAQELRRNETVDAKRLGQILMETGVSLAEVAPTPNAETAGIDGTMPEGAAATNGNGGSDLSGVPGGVDGSNEGAPSNTTPGGTPDWLTPPQN
jgi:hypothetical protein